MAIRTILTYPDPLLHRTSKPVKDFDVSLSHLVSDMVETMHHDDGIGLAAPQIGELLRLIVVEIPPADEERPILYAVCNPIIVSKEGSTRIEEGCLSLPGFYVEVDRAERIRIEGQNPDGTLFALDADGLTAICFQHELDHLDGKLLVNYVSSAKRELYRTEIKKKRGEDKGPEARTRML